MNIEPIISFHQIPHSDSLESMIRANFEDLDELSGQLVSCRAVVEVPHRNGQGEPVSYRVRLEVGIPGKHLVAECEPRQEDNMDAYEAVDVAFERVQRKLNEHNERLREGRHIELPSETPLTQGFIAALIDEISHRYGFVEDPDGRRLYFHEHALAEGSFDDLEEGMIVNFYEKTSPGSPEPVISTLHVEFDSSLLA